MNHSSNTFHSPVNFEFSSSAMDCSAEVDGIEFVDYVDEKQLDDVMALVGRDLSEPYSSKPSEEATTMESTTTAVSPASSIYLQVLSFSISRALYYRSQ